jgi:hypothetical protein
VPRIAAGDGQSSGVVISAEADSKVRVALVRGEVIPGLPEFNSALAGDTHDNVRVSIMGY